MANHKSAEKRHRQSLKRRDRNRSAKGAARTALKKAKSAIADKSQEAPVLARATESALASLVKKGIMPKKTASRLTSRLTKKAAKTAK